MYKKMELNMYITLMLLDIFTLIVLIFSLFVLT